MNEIINFFKNLTIDDMINFLIAILIVLLFQLLSTVFTKIILKIFHIKKKKNKKITDLTIFQPVNSFFKLLGVYLAILFLKVPENILALTNLLFHICVIFIVAQTLSSLLNDNSSFMKTIQNKFKVGKEKATISIITKTGKILIWAIAVILILYKLGYNINGLLASFGLIGVIITFAAQDTAKNLFGGFVMLIDKPFVVGDWIELGAIEGIVEDLSLRSTRIRTFDDSLITIPNSTVSNESIINWSQMKKRKITFDLVIELSNSLTQLNHAIDQLYLTLQQNKNVLQDNIQVHFEKITNDGYSIRISYFIQNTTFVDYLNIRQNVNFNLIQTLEKEKISLAYPSQSIYIKK